VLLIHNNKKVIDEMSYWLIELTRFGEREKAKCQKHGKTRDTRSELALWNKEGVENHRVSGSPTPVTVQVTVQVTVDHSLVRSDQIREETWTRYEKRPGTRNDDRDPGLEMPWMPGWKCPGSLTQTWCGSFFLKVKKIYMEKT
jgi:hypothetical protein